MTPFRTISVAIRILPLALLASACAPKEPPVPGMKIGKPYAIQGRTYTPAYDPGYDKTGEASWYGPGFHGKYTASGEVFNQDDMTAAHPTLPMPSMVRVTNLASGKSAIVRINDRGPFKSNRIIDLSRQSARTLGITSLARVRVQYLPEETEQYIAVLKASGSKALSMASYHARRDSLPDSQIVENTVAITQTGQTVTGAAPIQSVRSGALTAPEPVRNIAKADEAQEAAAEEEEDDAPAAQASAFRPAAAKAPRYIRDETGRPVQLKGASDTVKTAQAPAAKAFSPLPAAAKETPDAAGTAAEAGTAPAGGAIHIQVGSFASEENARRLDSRLSSIAAVTVARIRSAGRDWWRVRLGPFANGASASGALAKVHAAGLPDAHIIP